MDSERQKIDSILNEFKPIGLAEISSVALMNRVDAKYHLPANKLPEILRSVMQHYRVLEIDGKRIHSYETTYLDTDDLSMYRAHHNQKKNRFKIRTRSYETASFLEIKFKSNKGRTIKKRIERKGPPELTTKERAFISNETPFAPEELSSQLKNQFGRITLASLESQERITLDLDLRFENRQSETFEYEQLVIAETKRSGLGQRTSFDLALKAHGIRPSRFSKYCVGMALTNRNLKQNRFKKVILGTAKHQLA